MKKSSRALISSLFIAAFVIVPGALSAEMYYTTPGTGSNMTSPTAPNTTYTRPTITPKPGEVNTLPAPSTRPTITPKPGEVNTMPAPSTKPEMRMSTSSLYFDTKIIAAMDNLDQSNRADRPRDNSVRDNLGRDNSVRENRDNSVRDNSMREENRMDRERDMKVLRYSGVDNGTYYDEPYYYNEGYYEGGCY